MKKEKFFIRTVVLLITIICGAYCLFFAYRSIHDASKSKFSSNFKYGIVQTTSDKNLSYITYYDSNLKKVYTQKLKYGTMGETVQFPQVYSPKAYLVPHGIPGKKDLTKIVSVNMLTGKVKSYNMQQANITGYQASKYNLYSSAEVNGEILLSKCVKTTKELTTLSLGKVTLDSFYLFGDKLYAFTSSDKTSSVLLIDAESMKLLDTVDLSSLPGTKKDAVIAVDTLFFTNTVKKDGKTTVSIGSLNLLVKKAETIDLSIQNASQIFKYQDKLIVSAPGSNLVSVYDTTKKEETIHELKTAPVQCYVTGGKLYALDEDSFYIYNATTFELEKSVKVPLKKSKKATYHFTGFFLKP